MFYRTHQETPPFKSEQRGRTYLIFMWLQHTLYSLCFKWFGRNRELPERERITTHPTRKVDRVFSLAQALEPTPPYVGAALLLFLFRYLRFLVERRY